MLDWGPTIYLRNGEVQYFPGNTSPAPTGATYTPGQWYYFRIEYDTKAGTVGRWKLYMRERDSTAAERMVGEFDFMAKYGRRLSDIVQLGFGLYGPSAPWMYVDDVHLEARAE